MIINKKKFGSLASDEFPRRKSWEVGIIQFIELD